MIGTILRRVYMAAFALFLIGPIIVITAVSFNAQKFIASRRAAFRCAGMGRSSARRTGSAR